MQRNTLRERHTAILPVIHVQNAFQAMRNVCVAIDAGVDGVFLAGDTEANTKFKRIFSTVKTMVREVHPHFFFGIYFLDLGPFDAFIAASLLEASAVLIDDVTKMHGTNSIAVELSVLTEKYHSLFPQKKTASIFGGFACRYPLPLIDTEEKLLSVSRHIDIVTTTGKSETMKRGIPDPTKITWIKKQLGGLPFAVLDDSITPENVQSFLPTVTHLLVSTGISDDMYTLNPQRTALLVQKVNAYDRAHT